MIEAIKVWWYDRCATVYSKRLGRLQKVRHLLTQAEYDMFSDPMWSALSKYVTLSNGIKRRNLGAF